MHPSDGTLRRSLDEPAAVPASKRRHVATCARCAERVGRISADAGAVQAMLQSPSSGIDVTAARARLARTEAAAPQRPAIRVQQRSGRTNRLIAGLAVAVTASVVVVVSGGAQDFLSLFQPSRVAAVPVTASDVRSLAGLASYGSVAGASSITFEPEPDAAAAGVAAGIDTPVVGDIPAGTTGAPQYAVVSGGVVTFTFSNQLAEAAAARAGGHLPPLPAGLDGSTLSVMIAPAVVVSYGIDPSNFLRSDNLPAGEAFVVVKTRTPTVTSTGVTVHQLEEYLLSVPGIPAGVASEIRALGDPTQTIPIPIPVDVASGSPVSINGASGLLIGDSTGLGSAVIWQHNGVVYAIAGTVTTNQVLGIARSTR
jgi:anti-sigma factor RsiW